MELKARVLHALKWSAALKFLSQIVTWGTTIIVIRLLTPDDYGLMALALLFINFTIMMNELGLGAALVQSKELKPQVVRQVYSFILLANFVFFLILFLLAPVVADFFDEQRLTLIIQVLSIQFVISSFELVPMALLERKLNLKSKSLAQLVGQISGGVTALAFAYYGYGVWALVIGSLVDASIRAVAMNVVEPYIKVPYFSFKGMRDVLAFGGFVTGERVMWFFYNQADIFIIGKLLGKNLLGIYSVAMHLSSLIMHKTGEVIYTVSFPAFSKVQGDKDLAAQYLLKSVRILSFAVFPVFLGMAATSKELIPVLLGDTWDQAIPIFQILCLIMPLRMISNLIPPMLQGMGRPDVSLKNLLYAIVIMPLAFYLGSMDGLYGVSIAWLIAFPIVLFIMLYNSLPLVNLSITRFSLEMVTPFVASAFMYGVVVLLRDYTLQGVSDLLRLIILIVAGGLSYLLITLLINRKGFNEVLSLLQNR